MEVFCDGLLSGNRRPRLYLCKGAQAVKFTGSNIDGYCAISRNVYEKRGKWSNTTYTLNLAPGVRAVKMVSPLHGTWGDDLESWGELCQVLGLPIEVAREIVSREYPRTAERLNKAEQFASDVEARGGETETVVISFGSPTNRARREGYWASPKSGRTSDGRTVTVVPGESGGWSDPQVTEPEGAQVISARQTPGMHGGYVTVEVSVPSL